MTAKRCPRGTRKVKGKCIDAKLSKDESNEIIFGKRGRFMPAKKELISPDAELLIEITCKAGESKKHRLNHLIEHHFVSKMCGRKVCNYVLTKKGFGTLRNLEELGMPY